MKCLLLVPLAVCSMLVATEAHRFEARFKKDGADHTVHGTAFVRHGLVYTAAHNCEEGNFFIETWEGEIRCDPVRVLEATDVAILKPRVALRDSSGKDGCFASVEGKPVEQFKAELARNRARIKGFKSGGSGAPIYKDGKLVGMCISHKPGDDEDVAYVVTAVLDALKEN